MAFTFVLVLAAIFQVIAVILALRLNTIYRRRYAWLFISGAGVLMTLWIGASLVETVRVQRSIIWEDTLWIEALATLLTAILFFAGIATIEPLFKENEAARELLANENAVLNREVAHSRAELSLAQQVQAGLLPKSAPDIKGLDIAFLSRPAEWTSGDYFDFVKNSFGDLIVTVADACGHGLGPALLMTTSRSYFRVIAEMNDSCQHILQTWNAAVSRDVATGDFITALVVSLDVENKTIEYLGAGQNGLLIQPDGPFVDLERSGPPLGVIDDFLFPETNVIPMAVGQLLVLCTDGIAETVGRDGTQFGTDRICSIAAQHREKSADEILRKLDEELTRFSASTIQEDDITAVVIRVE